MKLLDRAIEATRPVHEIAKGLKLCATAIEKLATHIAVLAHNQAVHQQVIQKIWDVQQSIFAKLNEGSLDMQMPDIKEPSNENKAAAKKTKPN